MIAAEVMSRPVVSLNPTVPVRQAMVLLVEHGFGALPVVSQDERLLASAFHRSSQFPIKPGRAFHLAVGAQS
jgi:CBS domain-containing protein